MRARRRRAPSSSPPPSPGAGRRGRVAGATCTASTVPGHRAGERPGPGCARAARSMVSRSRVSAQASPRPAQPRGVAGRRPGVAERLAVPPISTTRSAPSASRAGPARVSRRPHRDRRRPRLRSPGRPSCQSVVMGPGRRAASRPEAATGRRPGPAGGASRPDSRRPQPATSAGAGGASEVGGDALDQFGVEPAGASRRGGRGAGAGSRRWS